MYRYVRTHIHLPFVIETKNTAASGKLYIHQQRVLDSSR